MGSSAVSSLGDYHVMSATKETGSRLQALFPGHRGDLAGAVPGGPQFRLGHPQHVFQSLGGCQVGPLMPGRGLRKLEPVIRLSA